MTDEELKRLRRYSDRVSASGGDIAVLEVEERNDLADLLHKWQSENEVPVNG